VDESDGDELLRLMILAALARSDGPLTAEELAQRLAAMLGVRLVPERGH
jgi:Fe2+ or Zn2+ uptake regulation protein